MVAGALVSGKEKNKYDPGFSRDFFFFGRKFGVVYLFLKIRGIMERHIFYLLEALEA